MPRRKQGRIRRKIKWVLSYFSQVDRRSWYDFLQTFGSVLFLTEIPAVKLISRCLFEGVFSFWHFRCNIWCTGVSPGSVFAAWCVFEGPKVTWLEWHSRYHCSFRTSQPGTKILTLRRVVIVSPLFVSFGQLLSVIHYPDTVMTFALYLFSQKFGTGIFRCKM